MSYPARAEGLVNSTIRLLSIISRTLVGGVLLLCRYAVCVFGSPPPPPDDSPINKEYYMRFCWDRWMQTNIHSCTRNIYSAEESLVQGKKNEALSETRTHKKLSCEPSMQVSKPVLPLIIPITCHWMAVSAYWKD